MNAMNKKFYFKSATILMSLIMTACTSIPKDLGVSDVKSLIGDKLNPGVTLPILRENDKFTAQQIDQMISEPLTLINAEQLSISQNPLIKVKLYQVGVAAADYAQAGRMENPGFSYGRFSGEDYDASLLFDIGGVMLMPLKRQLESRRLNTAKYQAAADVLEHIANTRRIWVDAVAAKQQTALMEKALESAEAGNNLTRQMSALGHSSVIEAADSEIFLSEMRTSLNKQRLSESSAKEALIRQLGLWGQQARKLALPDGLPRLPEIPLEVPSVEQQAIEGRLDVRMANMNLEAMAKNLKLTRLNPFLSAIELGPTLEKSEGEIDRGFELEFRIPIFDSGGIKTEKAKIIYDQAQAQAEVTAISAVSSARQALMRYQTSLEIAKNYRDVVLPLRERVSQEQLLMFNGMLISVFDLLDDLRSAMSMESAYVDAIKDFWIADTDLQQALTGSGMPGMNFEGSAMPSSAADGGGH
jgi:outer membrane protein TolC